MQSGSYQLAERTAASAAFLESSAEARLALNEVRTDSMRDCRLVSCTPPSSEPPIPGLDECSAQPTGMSARPPAAAPVLGPAAALCPAATLLPAADDCSDGGRFMTRTELVRPYPTGPVKEDDRCRRRGRNRSSYLASKRMA